MQLKGCKKINQLKPDVVFLDIQMPQISGIELLSMLDPETMPEVVFVTAYDQYALQAFEDNAFDYLLKPVDTERLAKTVQRLLRQHKKSDYSPLTQPSLDQIPCTGLNRIVLLPINEVEFAYSDISGVNVQTAQQKRDQSIDLEGVGRENRVSALPSPVLGEFESDSRNKTVRKRAGGDDHSCWP